MAYTTINKPKDHFDGKIYLGSSSAVTVTGLEFQPDWVWIKDRDNGNNHCLVDAVRGVGKYIQSDNNSAEVNNSTNSISAFTSDGFTTGTGNPANESASTTKGFMSWNWKANGQGSANTDGSISSTVSANTTAGFSIATWTTPSSGTQFTIGHGLGQAPDMMIMKCTTQSNSWFTYHKGLGGNVNDYLVLNEAAAEASQTNMWGANGAETNTMGFKAGTSSYTSQPMVGYFFAEKQGYSKFGSYTGNGNADGSFIYTGFKPAFVLIKYSTSTSGWWQMQDNKRDVDNPTEKAIFANVSDAEYSNANYAADFLSNGIKMRNATAGSNTSGGTYIYMAFAEAPLVGSNNVPCTAR